MKTYSWYSWVKFYLISHENKNQDRHRLDFLISPIYYMFLVFIRIYLQVNSDEYPEHTFWVFIRTGSQRQFWWVPETYSLPEKCRKWTQIIKYPLLSGALLLLLALRTIWDPSKHEVNSMSSALTACMYAQPSLTTDTTLLEFLWAGSLILISDM